MSGSVVVLTLFCIQAMVALRPPDLCFRYMPVTGIQCGIKIDLITNTCDLLILPQGHTNSGRQAWTLMP